MLKSLAITQSDCLPHGATHISHSSKYGVHSAEHEAVRKYSRALLGNNVNNVFWYAPPVEGRVIDTGADPS